MTQRKPLVIGSTGLPTVLATADELPDTALPTNPTLKGLAGVKLPSGSIADRSPTPGPGVTRYNTELGCPETYTPEGWVALSNVLVSAYRGNVGPTTGTTRIPLDNTPPLVTEGTQLWSKTVTPKYVGSVMTIDFTCMVDNGSTSQSVQMALFRDNTLLAVTSTAPTGASGNKPQSLTLSVNDTTISLTAVTYQVRIGNESTATWYVGRGSGATLGGVNNAGWKIDEVLP